MANYRAPECASGSCVQTADVDEDRISVRNSNDPDGPAVVFTREEMGVFAKAWLRGEFGPTGLPDAEPHQAFTAAHKLAPVPETKEAATRDVWIRHYAAVALAAYAVFCDEIRTVSPHTAKGSRPELGYLIGLSVAAHAAADALTEGQGPQCDLWLVTPECGSLNGENIDALADLLNDYGINPADIDPRFEADDFTTPSALAATGPAGGGA